MSELASKLREYNDWRRGALISQPDHVELGRAIDAAIIAIEQRDELLAVLEELNSASARGFLYDDPARVKARKAIASAKDHFRDATKMIARSKPTAP